MEDLSYMWTTCEESPYDLKQKILSTDLELESMKSLVTESQPVAYEERNELQTILKMDPNSTPVNHSSGVVPTLMPPKPELSNLFETCIHPQRHDFSLADPSFDALPSQQNLPNINCRFSHKQLLTEELINTTTSIPITVNASFAHNDKIDRIAKSKSLPQKGKLLQAVMDTTPLLKTLLVTGPPLPKWRNPPTLKIPPISLGGCGEILSSFSQKQVATSMPSNYMNSLSYPGFSQEYSTAMLNFNHVPYVFPSIRWRPLNQSSCSGQQIPAAKRCRFQ